MDVLSKRQPQKLKGKEGIYRNQSYEQEEESLEDHAREEVKNWSSPSDDSGLVLSSGSIILLVLLE